MILNKVLTKDEFLAKIYLEGFFDFQGLSYNIFSAEDEAGNDLYACKVSKIIDGNKLIFEIDTDYERLVSILYDKYREEHSKIN